ncbi:COX15/CtaA family protein [Micavibrio aeruginosavorus]|uniref:COX15/CtaA family protein n=1 Tax=Micavibrio aeruginosavorus TaxID=349221 RepID=UPI003F4A9EF4
MSTDHQIQSTAPHRKIAVWLFICCFMVLSMAMIGAVTRLTESGLSITEWKPIAGALPPLNEEAWQAEFDLYKQTPEYDAKHFWMQLSDFKKIYFWEWLHRLWGRAIGIVFAVPLVWFAVRKQIPPGYGLKFIGLLALGGAQGFIGWFMVQSGLIDRPSVSHFRLSLHLFMAALVFALMLWLTIGLWRGTARKITTPKSTIITGWIALAMVSITIIWGAFVAGLDAGMIYNEFPHMGAGLIPPDFRTHATIIGDIMQNPAAVQFTHRWLAITTLCVTGLYIWLRTKSGAVTGDVAALGAMILIQVGLGIAALLTQVDIHVATAHQAGAFILLGLLLNAQHRLIRG